MIPFKGKEKYRGEILRNFLKFTERILNAII